MSYRIKADMLLCQGHGICKEECPEVFSVVDQGTGYPKVSIATASPPPELRAQVEDAVRYCPNQVLKLIEVE